MHLLQKGAIVLLCDGRLAFVALLALAQPRHFGQETFVYLAGFHNSHTL